MQGLAEDLARWFFQQLIVALDFCHKKGIANRDIKLEVCSRLFTSLWTHHRVTGLQLRALMLQTSQLFAVHIISSGCSAFRKAIRFHLVFAAAERAAGWHSGAAAAEDLRLWLL